MDILYVLRRNQRLCFRHKSLTLVNILGLGIGLAVTMFLLFYLCFELSYDRNFADAGRIYRILNCAENSDREEYYPRCLKELAVRLVQDVPEVESVAQLHEDSKTFSLSEQKNPLSIRGYNVDSSFFQVFNFGKVYGELKGIFTEPGQCVLTQSASVKLFGEGTNPVGQYLYDGGRQAYEVMAVIEDLPENSHFRFEFLLPITPEMQKWDSPEFFTYLKLREGVKAREALEKCNWVHRKLKGTYFDESAVAMHSATESLTSIHNSTKSSYDLSPTNSWSRLFFIMLVGILVLGIAVSNFISLFMIQGEKRTLEVGLRRVGGASRGKIVGMLLGETFLITFLAFILGLFLFIFFAPTLANVLNIHIPDLSWQINWIGGIFAILYLVTASIAGIYPAWNLSRSQPVELMRRSVVRKFRLTIASVVIQFSIVIFCVSALWIVVQQLNYVVKQPFGFETENVMCYYIGTNQAQGKSIRNELAKYPSVVSVGFCQSAVESEGSGNVVSRIDDEDQEISVDERRIGDGFFETLEIPLLMGKGFSGTIANNGSNIILSETALKSLNLKDPIGKKILYNGDEFTVIGVARDCRYGSARMEFGDVIYTSNSDRFYRMYVHFQPGKYEDACNAVKAVLATRYPGISIGMSVLKDDIIYYYAQDQVAMKTLKLGVCLAILLALLGLGALCGFVAREKSKEIGIRRISGAYVEDIVSLMLRYVLWRIVPAIPIGIVASYLIMDQWLDGFKFAVSISWWIYALTVLGLLFASAGVVFFKSWNAATTNPVNALKSE